MAATAQPSVAAIVVAAGAGTRLGADVPKAFVRVAGQTLLAHVRERLLSDQRITEAIVVAPEGWLEQAAAETGASVVAGGDTRRESVAAGLVALRPEAEFVLVHDVARPFAPRALVDRVVAALAEGADAVVPALRVTDTIKNVDEAGSVIVSMPRDSLYAVQTPQGFRTSVLIAAHARAGDSVATDDAGLVEEAAGLVQVVEGAREAFKITDAWDLALAEWIVARG